VNVNLERVLRGVIEELNRDWKMEELYHFDGETNLFKIIDSFSLLSIVIETEAAIESKVGRYVPLADSDLMVNGVSPFVSFDKWVSFVSEKIN